ncbi:hypothetical protein H8356DRAFT_934103 [Neocallimastix lanati (nom. inval.)]|nr:hypothetical protein H8356DRAFT_934103 [Neocallimastix sp. JGI-2020a]
MDTETIQRARKKYLFNEDESILYNDEEQEEIIDLLTEKNDKNNEKYSIAISIGFIILNLFFTFELIINSFTFLSFFIVFLSWLVICCTTTTFRQYTTHKYYVRLENEDDDDNNGKEDYDSNNSNGNGTFKKLLAKLNFMNNNKGGKYKKTGPKYKRYTLSDDQEVPLSPYKDVVNYISIALSLIIMGLTIGCQNWLHINFVVPFLPLIMTVANIYASAIIDETTTEINSLKDYKSPFKGA